MGMGHAAGVAAALVVQGQAASVQSVPISELQRLLTQQGVDLTLHSPPSHSGNRTSYTCGLDRCIASPLGDYNTSTCAGVCKPLAEQEWIGSVEAWAFENTSDVAGALLWPPTNLG